MNNQSNGTEVGALGASGLSSRDAPHLRRTERRRAQQQTSRDRLKAEGLDEYGQPLNVCPTDQVLNTVSTAREQVDSAPASNNEYHSSSLDAFQSARTTFSSSASSPAHSIIPPVQEAIDDPRIAHSRADMEFWTTYIRHTIALFSFSSPLTFILNPMGADECVPRRADQITRANAGPCLLDVDCRSNLPFLEHENWIISTIAGLQADHQLHNDSQLNHRQTELVDCLHQELSWLEHYRSQEWNRQRMPVAAAPAFATKTSIHVDTTPYFNIYDRHMSPLVFAYCIVALIMSLLQRLPRRGSKILLAGLRTIVRLSLTHERGRSTDEHHTILEELSKDIRTILHRFDLNPRTHAYACCPNCFALHERQSCPQSCTHQETSESNPCGAKLWRTRTIRGKQFAFPSKVFLYQDMKEWMARLLSRDGIEKAMDSANERAQAGPKHKQADIWDARVFQTFKGPDGIRPFVDAPSNEGRYLFSLSVDGFNPFHMKIGKQKSSVTGIYMVCLNLPPHLRYLPENTFLVGIIPGPTKSSLEQINHFLRPLVDDLLTFWNAGVFYTRTAAYPLGRLVRCALIPLICDLPAARQVSGHGAHSSTYFCSFCKLRLDQIENLNPSTWPKRDPREHRRHAEEWQAATNAEARASIFRKHGVRWSELLRLPYWDPIAFTIIDTMHNHYLGLLKTHCREIWGMNVDIEDGDGTYVHDYKTPPRPSDVELNEGMQRLYNGTVKELAGCRKNVLWHLCFEHDLQRAKKKKQLLDNLVRWRVQTGYGIAESTNAPNPSDENHKSTSPSPIDVQIKKAEQSLKRGSQPKTIARSPKAVLVAMCTARDLDTSGVKAVLAGRLVEWQLHAGPSKNENSTSPPTPVGAGSTSATATMLTASTHHRKSSNRDASSVVLGRDTLTQVHEDMKRTQLPSWISPAPSNIGSEQRGKLSADQWFSACSIHLPVTLVRLWGHEQGRKQKMLENYMDLLTAVIVCSMRETSHEHILVYNASLMRYLRSLKELYKEAEIKPNHHVAVHVGEFLQAFGPVHSIRTFFSERMNYLLMRQNTSGKFGELELTYLNHACRASNLRGLIQRDGVRQITEELVGVYDAVYHEDRRGTRLRDSVMINASPLGVHGKRTKAMTISDAEFEALLHLLNLELGQEIYVDVRSLRIVPGRVHIRNSVISCKKIFINGVTYRPYSASPNDSNVVFTHPQIRVSRAGRVKQIFTHTRHDTQGHEIQESFLIVECLQELTETDLVHDPYRRFLHAGGRLCYDSYLADVIVIRPTRVISHFAKTPMIVPGISRSCVHVLALDRMLDLVSPMPDSDEEAEGEGGEDDGPIEFWETLAG